MLGLNSLFLFSPPPEEAFYGYWIAFTRHVGIPRNYDSEEFASLAADPSKLLEPECKRQSRPLSVWLAHAMAYPFGELHVGVFSGLDVAYVLQNFVLLIASAMLFARLCRRQSVPSWAMLGLVVPLVCNDLTKAFFWNNHQQMFAVFTPLFLIWMCVFLWESISVSRCVQVSLFTGVLFLGYGTWMLAPPLIAGIALLKYVQRQITAKQCVAYMSAVLLFALPILCWVGYVIMRNGRFYSAEVSLVHQFVWLPDALSKGVANAIWQCADFVWQYGRTFKSWEVLPFLLVGSILVVKNRKTLSNVEISSIVVCGLFFVFLYLLGYYRNRLTFSLAVPMLVCIASHLAKWKHSAVALLLFDIWWVAFHVVKHGPYH